MRTSLLALAVALAGCGALSSIPFIDENRPAPGTPPTPPEAAALPAPPPVGGLLELDPGYPTRNRFAVDPASLAIDGKTVRFTLVITSEAGVRNVSHDAVHCENSSFAVLAIGRGDGTWTPVRNPGWRVWRGTGLANAHYRAITERVCRGDAPAPDLATLMRRWREQSQPASFMAH